MSGRSLANELASSKSEKLGEFQTNVGDKGNRKRKGIVNADIQKYPTVGPVSRCRRRKEPGADAFPPRR